MTNMQNLEGKVAVVTGGGGNIGRGVCVALAEAGADVAVFDIEPDAAEAVAELVRQHGRRAAAVVLDLTDRAACAAGVDQAVDELGSIDVLVNLAQRFRSNIAFLDHTEDDMDVMWDSGPMTTFRMMQLCHPHLAARGDGSIVNFASSVGTSGLARHAAYAAAKEAIRGLTKVASQEWGPDGIRVNALCPVATTDPNAPWITDELLATIPLRRIGNPHDDIGVVVAYFAGPGSAYITGQTLMVDGGVGVYR
jgi:NAD(P)-dependent dehydrogenase (short-subunit alcohol dehydrogenase family)